MPAPTRQGNGVAIVIAKENGRFVQRVLVTENALRCGSVHEVTRFRGAQAQPARVQNAEEVGTARARSAGDRPGARAATSSSTPSHRAVPGSSREATRS